MGRSVPAARRRFGPSRARCVFGPGVAVLGDAPRPLPGAAVRKAGRLRGPSLDDPRGSAPVSLGPAVTRRARPRSSARRIIASRSSFHSTVGPDSRKASAMLAIPMACRDHSDVPAAPDRCACMRRVAMPGVDRAVMTNPHCGAEQAGHRLVSGVELGSQPVAKQPRVDPGVYDDRPALVQDHGVTEDRGPLVEDLLGYENHPHPCDAHRREHRGLSRCHTLRGELRRRAAALARSMVWASSPAGAGVVPARLAAGAWSRSGR